MSGPLAPKDLIAIVADKDMQYAIRGLLTRHQALGVRPLRAEVRRHPQHDPACLLDAHELLRPFLGEYAHALVMFDRNGCGQESLSRAEIESLAEKRLHESGWDDRAACIVLDPELEIWVWSDSPHVDEALGWKGKQPDLRSWLIQEGFVQAEEQKPRCPKAAMRKALREAGVKPSASRFLQLAQYVGLERCIDPAFEKFKTILRTRFSEGS